MKLQCFLYLLSVSASAVIYFANRSHKREQLCWSDIWIFKTSKVFREKIPIGSLWRCFWKFHLTSTSVFPLPGMFLVLSVGSLQEYRWGLLHVTAEECGFSVCMEIELKCQRKGKDDVFIKAYIHRDFQRHLRDLGLQILLTSNGTLAPTTFRGLVALCLPKRKSKKVNPGKLLQKDFELTCFKTVLFIVLLRCLTEQNHKSF